MAIQDLPREWIKGGAGDAPVIEPATGEELGTHRTRQPSTTWPRRRSARASRQREWAALPHSARAAVLRKAGDLFEEHDEEISSVDRARVAAASPSRPDSKCTPPPRSPTKRPRSPRTRRASCSQRDAPTELLAPIPRRRRRRDRTVQLPADPLDPLGRPGLALGNAVILKPDPRTAVCGGVVLARVFEEAGLPAGVFSVLPGGADVGEALVEDPSCASSPSPVRPRPGRAVGSLARPAPQARAPRTRRELRDDHHGRRRPREARGRRWARSAPSRTRVRSA